MPRRKRTQEERERFLVREFVQQLGYQIIRIESPDRPDVSLKVTKGGRTLRIGVEHTDYNVDAPPGTPSPGRAICGFWELVQASLRMRISHRPVLQTTLASVSFRREKVTYLPRKLSGKQELARSVASQIVDLALAHLPGRGEQRHWWRRDLIGECALLAEWFNHVTLWRQEQEIQVNPYCHWRCLEATTACIGPVKQNLERIFRTKAEKARSYSWDDADERWLLVAASGSPPYSGIGPWTEEVAKAIASAWSACQTARFHRVFVWERVRKWCKQVWPDAPVVYLGR